MHIVRSLNTQRINLVNESLYVKRQRMSGQVCITFDGPVAGRKLISLRYRQPHHHHYPRLAGPLKSQNRLKVRPEPQGVAVVPPHYQRTYGKIMQTKIKHTKFLQAKSFTNLHYNATQGLQASACQHKMNNITK